MAMFYDNRWVSVPCPNGKPGCAVNHVVLRADYDKLRQEQKDTSAEWTRQYEKGIEDGRKELANEIIEWVISNRRVFELDDDVSFYRDSFNSENLIEFIEKSIDGKKE